jgi:molybdate transport system regulatory protein
MKKKRNSSSVRFLRGVSMSSIWPFLRIQFGDVNDYNKAIGPHRANMLEAIDRFGSISAAAPAVDLTFRQLWRQVQVLNSLFDQPLIGIRRSGRSSGAFLTPLGKEVLARFREMQQVANETLEPHFRTFEKLVGLDPDAPPPVPRYARIVDPATIPIARKQKRVARASTKAKNRSGKKASAKSRRSTKRR